MIKGGTIKNQGRDHILSKDFFNRLREQKGITLSDKEIKDIIISTNHEIAETVATSQDGVKLPFSLGYILVTKFKSKRKLVDWAKTRQLGVKVMFTNAHSAGYRFSIRWYNYKNKFNYYPAVYKFDACRTFSRRVSKSIKEEFPFQHWEFGDFINHGQIGYIMKRYSKKYGSDKSE